ncbi:uncharacterized protein C2845_PM01G38350 [Panicum miliaceum]|uniref:Dof zinc finger protein n=1 Tax=Panicum miliaceum TaxID=4540 RepID=A0A3L6TLU8_PANMI|nr:uncharacterized protein C2845_PM01G38350 [Panicum miliaceum]
MTRGVFVFFSGTGILCRWHQCAGKCGHGRGECRGGGAEAGRPERGRGAPAAAAPAAEAGPRCQSGNTKFCYYNNYSRAQPRYLCKACRRHWTEGGMLRDVPVGGGRKNRRGGNKGGGAAAKASASTAAATQGGGVGGADTFPDLLRQLVHFQPGAAAVGGGGYAIDLSAWQQMAAATAPPQGADDASALGGAAAAAAEANCGALTGADGSKMTCPAWTGLAKYYVLVDY